MFDVVDEEAIIPPSTRDKGSKYRAWYLQMKEKTAYVFKTAHARMFCNEIYRQKRRGKISDNYRLITRKIGEDKIRVWKAEKVED